VLQSATGDATRMREPRGRHKNRRARELLAGIKGYIERLDEHCRRAATHRLGLVAANNPCALARAAKVPVYVLTGFIDPIVPWFPVKRWFTGNCPALRGWRIIWNADHNVLGTAPVVAADQVVRWLNDKS